MPGWWTRQTLKKIQYMAIPYSKITWFSIETSGHFDLDAKLKLWTGSDKEPLPAG